MLFNFIDDLGNLEAVAGVGNCCYCFLKTIEQFRLLRDYHKIQISVPPALR
jgi:hypothetical protein